MSSRRQPRSFLQLHLVLVASFAQQPFGAREDWSGFTLYMVTIIEIYSVKPDLRRARGLLPVEAVEAAHLAGGETVIK